MATNVIMPVLGMSQDKGVLVRWMKQEGDLVKKGEPLMEVETDKANVEIDAPATGILSQISAREGDEVPVAQVIAMIVAESEMQGAPPDIVEREDADADGLSTTKDGSCAYINASPVAARIAKKNNVDLGRVKSRTGRIQKADVLQYLEDGQKSIPVVDRTNKILASPKARRIASEMGINLSEIQGTGPDGVILANDVAAYKPSSLKSAKETTISGIEQVKLDEKTPSRIWQAMARRTTQSWKSAPHFYLQRQVNASMIIEWRKAAHEYYQRKITFTDLFVMIISLALKQNQQINAVWNDGKIYTSQSISIGVAMAIDDGLIVPVIKEADKLSLDEVSAWREVTIERASSGKLRQEDLEGGTFTISNLGMYGVDSFNAVLNPPQAAILAIGRISEHIVPINSQPVIQPMVTLNLTCDHRVIDGASGAKFLTMVARFIEQPLFLL